MPQALRYAPLVWTKRQFGAKVLKVYFKRQIVKSFLVLFFKKEHAAFTSLFFTRPPRTAPCHTFAEKRRNSARGEFRRLTDYIRDSNVSIGADRFDMAQGARHGMAGRMTQTPPVEPETQACEALEAEAAGKTMAYEGFPRSVPAAFRRFATAWLTGYDAAARPNGRDRQA